jgi:hypothetical protein
MKIFSDRLPDRPRYSKRHISLFSLVFAAMGTVILISTIAAPNTNPADDLNNDSIVDLSDLSIVLSGYNTAGNNSDINLDGKTDVLDLSAMLSDYGRLPASER